MPLKIQKANTDSQIIAAQFISHFFGTDASSPMASLWNSAYKGGETPEANQRALDATMEMAHAIKGGGDLPEYDYNALINALEYDDYMLHAMLKNGLLLCWAVSDESVADPLRIAREISYLAANVEQVLFNIDHKI